MGSKIENVAVIDSNALANEIMFDIQDVERMESDFEMELSSEELFRIDCAILSGLRNTKDFSRSLIEQLESGLLKEVAFRPPKISDEFRERRHDDEILDLELPIKSMFCEMEKFVVEALR